MLCLGSCALSRLTWEAASHRLTTMAGTLMKLVMLCCFMRDSMFAASKAGWKTCTPKFPRYQSTAQQQSAAPSLPHSDVLCAPLSAQI